MATINWSKWIKHIQESQDEALYKDRIAQALNDAIMLMKANAMLDDTYIKWEGIAKIYNVREQDLKNAYDHKHEFDGPKYTIDFGRVDEGVNDIHKSGCFYDAINRDAEEILKAYGVPNEYINPEHSQPIRDNSWTCGDIPPDYSKVYCEGDKRSGKTQKVKDWNTLKEKQDEEKLTDRYKVLAIKMGQKLKSGKIFRKLIRKKKPIYSTEYTHIQREFERLNNIL